MVSCVVHINGECTWVVALEVVSLAWLVISVFPEVFFCSGHSGSGLVVGDLFRPALAGLGSSWLVDPSLSFVGYILTYLILFCKLFLSFFSAFFCHEKLSLNASVNLGVLTLEASVALFLLLNPFVCAGDHVIEHSLDFGGDRW